MNIQDAIETIDTEFKKGFAKSHPNLLAAMITAIAAEKIEKQLKAIAENLSYSFKD